MSDRTHRELTGEDIARIAKTYHAWRSNPPQSPFFKGGSNQAPPFEKGGSGGIYADVAGFCKSASLEEVRKHGHVLTPGRYVGAEAQEDDGEPFEEKVKRLAATLRGQQVEGKKLDEAIAVNLRELGYGG
jgi:type I restriction enzyme M protein